MKRYQAVCVSLLVNEVVDERVYLTVNIWVCLEYVRMASVCIGCLTLLQNVAERSQVVVVPVVVDKPLCLDERNVILGHADRNAALNAVCVLLDHQLFIVLYVALEHITGIIVVATVARLALLAPYLNHSATSRFAREQEVITAQARISELVGTAGKIPLVPRMGIDVGKTLIVLGTPGKLTYQVNKTHVVHLSNARAIPSAEVAHIAVDEEVVRLHIVRPAVKLAVAPAVPLAMNNETAY